MTVRDLAELLATFPPDAMLIDAREGGHLVPELHAALRLAMVAAIGGGFAGSTEYVVLPENFIVPIEGPTPSIFPAVIVE